MTSGEQYAQLAVADAAGAVEARVSRCRLRSCEQCGVLGTRRAVARPISDPFVAHVQLHVPPRI